MTVDPELLSEAVVVWIGTRTAMWPSPDDERVIARYGEDLALDLLPAVRRLHDEFFESDAAHTIADLSEMGRAAAARFRRLHPEIGADAVDALARCYTFTFR